MCPSICYNKTSLPLASTLPLAYLPPPDYRPRYDRQISTTVFSFAKGLMSASPIAIVIYHSDPCGSGKGVWT